MIKLTHNAVDGWKAHDTETGATATATFTEGKEVALGRLHDATNDKAAKRIAKRNKKAKAIQDEAEI